ncbi:hypothetical protein Dimus_013521 [Dionaea muscipula]
MFEMQNLPVTPELGPKSDALVAESLHAYLELIRFGTDVMETVASWTRSVCSSITQRTGNGLLLQELAKHGFSDLTGIDYSEDTINLTRGRGRGGRARGRHQS